MVDVTQKDQTKRTAVAVATICFPKVSFDALLNDECPKGNVFETAKVAGIMAAKATPTIIPLCHPLELGKVKMSFDTTTKANAVIIKCEVAYVGKTGVEMEALTAVSVSALTMYDMMKFSDKGIVISDVKLLEKNGGKSGDYQAK